MSANSYFIAVMGAGAGKFFLGGPPGAFSAGIIAVGTMDSIYTAETGTPQGYFAAVTNVIVISWQGMVCNILIG